MSPRGSSPRLLRGGGNRASVSLRAIRGDTRLLIRRSVPVQQARRHRGFVAFGRRAPQTDPAAAARDGRSQRGAGALGGGSGTMGARDARGQPRQPPPQEEAPVPHDGPAPSERQGPRAAPQSAAAREDRDRSFANQRAIARTNLIGEDTNVAAGRRQAAHGEAEIVAGGRSVESVGVCVSKPRAKGPESPCRRRRRRASDGRATSFGGRNNLGFTVQALS